MMARVHTDTSISHIRSGSKVVEQIRGPDSLMRCIKTDKAQHC